MSKETELELKARILDVQDANTQLQIALKEAHETLVKVAEKVGVEPSESGNITFEQILEAVDVKFATVEE